MTTDHPPTGFQPVQSLPPEPTRPPWLMAIAALVLVALGGVAIGAFVFGGAGRDDASPSPTAIAEVSPSPVATASPTATATASPATPTAATPAATTPAAPTSPPPPSPTGPAQSPAASPVIGPDRTISPDVAAMIDAVVAQVPPIRDLEPLRDVPYEMVSREQFREDLLQILEEETDPVQLAAEERLLKRLGLLPDDLDLQTLLLELYGAGVAAYYQPQDGTFYVIERDAPFGPLDRMYVAHEYTHALQDHHYDLEGTRITDQSQGDAILAQLAGIEGDASWLMVLWAQQHLTFDELFEMLSESLAPADEELLANMPPILVRQLTFPYEQGLIFVSGIHADGGWDAVNDLLVEPPLSTEQVLHPEKYHEGEEPVVVELPDLASALGAGWERTYEQTFGELSTDIWLTADEEPRQAMPRMPPEYPYSDVSAGWGGDRLAMYEDGDDGWAVGWELAWDTEADADDFLERALELEDTLDGATEIAQVEPRVVRVLLAHDADALAAFAEALGD